MLLGTLKLCIGIILVALTIAVVTYTAIVIKAMLKKG